MVSLNLDPNKLPALSLAVVFSEANRPCLAAVPEGGRVLRETPGNLALAEKGVEELQAKHCCPERCGPGPTVSDSAVELAAQQVRTHGPGAGWRLERTNRRTVGPVRVHGLMGS